MRFLGVSVKSFGSFGDTAALDFEPGINLIVGQNNVGKSALLRAFDPGHLADDRHRNEHSFRKERLEAPIVRYIVRISAEELETSILRGGQPIAWPISDTQTGSSDPLKEKGKSEFTFALFRNGGQQYATEVSPSHREFSGPYSRHLILRPMNGHIGVEGPMSGAGDSLHLPINDVITNSLFSFSAQRFGIGKYVFGRAERLSPNASNLAQILAVLQGERGGIFAEIVGNVREIFPTIANMSVTTTERNEFEIMTWPTERMERRELGFSLDSSGTGVSQVVAILTVMAMFTQAVIVIDEINSFLHPAATKSLLRIAQTRYNKHQYIISTHSPDVIGESNAVTVHLVRRAGYESSIERVDLSKVDHFRDLADQLGISMTDVFGAERIVWVEGQTEAICFPYVYTSLCGPLPRGLIFVPLIATGDFFAKTKRRELVLDIYRRLSAAASPLVKSVIFSFDREELTEGQRRDLTKRTEGGLAFLPRRHFECFLIDAAAIAAFLRNHVPELDGLVSPTLVGERLRTLAGEPKFRAAKEWNGDVNNEDWLISVNAANLIKTICTDLSDSRIIFAKTRHSLELLQHIVASNRAALEALVEYVRKLVEATRGSASTPAGGRG